MSIFRTNPRPQYDNGAKLAPISIGVLFHDRYEIVRCIGAGGMGAVYEVRDRTTQRRRVLKTLLPGLVGDADVRARFVLEATITAAVESEHIVEVFDAGFDGATGVPFLVMELLKGENLGDTVDRLGHVGPSDLLLLFEQVSFALEKTHAAGIVHRDLKPENLFVSRRDDGAPLLKILDFGIAKVIASSTQLRTTRGVGSPLYMAPEQIRGDADIDERADLYALGQIAYTLLVGTPYWYDESTAPERLYPLLLRVAGGVTEPASVRAKRYGTSLPAGFDPWFARATAVSPSQRFESVSELVNALGSALELGGGIQRGEVALQPTASALVPPSEIVPAEPVPSESNAFSGLGSAASFAGASARLRERRGRQAASHGASLKVASTEAGLSLGGAVPPRAQSRRWIFWTFGLLGGTTLGGLLIRELVVSIAPARNHASRYAKPEGDGPADGSLVRSKPTIGVTAPNASSSVSSRTASGLIAEVVSARGATAKEPDLEPLIPVSSHAVEVPLMQSAAGVSVRPPFLRSSGPKSPRAATSHRIDAQIDPSDTR